LGINDGSFAIGTLHVNVSGGSSGSGNEPWGWWNWWERNSSTLPGNWVFKLNKGRGVWKSSLGLLGSIIAELFGLLSINDGSLSIGTLLISVRCGSSGSANEPWGWWNWWESNSSTLPGDWICSLDESGGIWESSLSFLCGFITELFGLLSINNGSLSIGTLLVSVSGGTSGSANEPWGWWNWWESNSSTLPGDWVFNLDEASSEEFLWSSSSNAITEVLFITVSLGESNSSCRVLLSIFVVLLSGWAVHGNVVSHGLANSVSFSPLSTLLSIVVALLTLWAIDSNVVSHGLTDGVSFGPLLLLLSVFVGLLSSWSIHGDVSTHGFSNSVAISELAGIEESNSNVLWLVMVMVVFTKVNSLGGSKEKSHDGS
jgi:hypothetical protein